MTDRNLFDKKVLANGMTLHTKIVDTSYSVVEVIIPVGSFHNTGAYLPGTFHFLEHMCCNRSQLFPERNSFKKFLGLKSASNNASTSSRTTNYYFSTPNQFLADILPGFIASIFHPLFSPDDLELERTIVSNERQRRERWYPGSNELSQYLNTQWLWDKPISLDQLLGNSASLEQISLEKLNQAHSNYFTDKVQVLYIGQQDSPLLEDLLSQIKTRPLVELAQNYDTIRWTNRDYHVKAFRDVSRHQLYFGAFNHHAQPNLEESIAQHFIKNYLCNHVHGPIYDWLRHEKGWVYEIDGSTSSSRTSTDWHLMFPLNNQQQVDEVRQELWPRVEQALQDKQAIDLEVTRALGKQAYAYQTTASFIDSAVDNIKLFGQIIPFSDVTNGLEKCRDLDYVGDTYQKFFNPVNVGSFCAIPETTSSTS